MNPQQQQVGSVRTAPPLVYGGGGGGWYPPGQVYYQPAPGEGGEGLVERLEEIAFLHQEPPDTAAVLDHDIDR